MKRLEAQLILLAFLLTLSAGCRTVAKQSPSMK